MRGRHCLDANIFIAAWHQGYPNNIFPSLWEQLAQNRNDIILIKSIFNEIEPISSSDLRLSQKKKREKYPLRVWMEENQFDATGINDDTNALSLEMEREYETSNESRGAGQNDITLIAFAKIMDKTVVTNEGEQREKPAKKSKYKIPLICDEQSVDCINFVDMLKRFSIRI